MKIFNSNKIKIFNVTLRYFMFFLSISVLMCLYFNNAIAFSCHYAYGGNHFIMCEQKTPSSVAQRCVGGNFLTLMESVNHGAPERLVQFNSTLFHKIYDYRVADVNGGHEEPYDKNNWCSLVSSLEVSPETYGNSYVCDHTVIVSCGKNVIVKASDGPIYSNNLGAAGLTITFNKRMAPVA